MNLLALLIVFALWQRWGSGGFIQRDGWFYSLADMLNNVALLRKSFSWLIPCLLVLIPGVLLVWLISVFNHQFFGLAYLILAVVVLLYSLGRGQLNDQIEGYLERWRSGDLQGAYHIASEFSHKDALDQTEDPASLHRHAIEGILYQGLERWFAVIFWFALFGPVAALGYRLLYLYSELDNDLAERQKPVVLRVLHWLEWLPATVLGFSFALAGNFGSCFKVWVGELFILPEAIPQVLSDYGIAALGDNSALACQGECSAADYEDMLHHGSVQIEAIQHLLNRCVILWLVAVSLLFMVL
ncbi:MAG: regulatory signaling modulator protein AmpE [Pseudomonadales bacterium]